MNNIYIATTNQGKVKEFKQILADLSIEVESLLDQFPDMDDVEETGKTFKENAILKAETYSSRYQVPVIADDSGLEVTALDGEPGIYSARYAGEAKNDSKNLEKVLAKLEEKQATNREAAFVCVMAFANPGHDTLTTEGRCEGSITTQPQGDQGFGYDPIFQPKGYESTLAELGPEVKNEISHRRQAINKMVEQLKTVL
ncbi:XTP/dITP diphosphatase [Alkalibacillus aidingensis]|uniref:XTP/dITP diphosphatase n=1 Tax=Alkalibacillus aidingensis TaxID=2747607 RepID=UPI0016604B89|nr:XTP/dITP diphosphatase [Alkalibacillus aidingensis]